MDTRLARAECSPKLSPKVRGRALVDAWRQSGLSQSAFARQHQVKKQQVHYWSKRIPPSKAAENAEHVAIESPDFVQIAVQVPRSSAPPPLSAPSMEILLPGGAVIRLGPGADPSLFRLAIRELVKTPC